MPKIIRNARFSTIRNRSMTFRIRSTRFKQSLRPKGRDNWRRLSP